MDEVRPEFLALDRDELLFLCEALAGRYFLAAEQDHYILRARWYAATQRAQRAEAEYSKAHSCWSGLVMSPGKLTSQRLAEQEKAERRHKRLRTIAERHRTAERQIWEQIFAGWNEKGAET